MKLSELQHEIRTADPSALLVSSRVLDRVLLQEYRLPSVLWRIPHRHCYVVDRHVLFRHVEQDELDLEPERLLPATVILLARPTPEELAVEDRRPLLLKYWRRLFHACLHRELQVRREEGRLTDSDISARIEELGAVEFAEIRRVLTEDAYLPRSADDRMVYVEFAAVFLELRYFAANLLPASFPALRDLERVRRLLVQDVDAEALFQRTRLEGAPEPVVHSDTSADESHDYFWKLLSTAERASRSGNTVRAAILRTRAARVAPAAYDLCTRVQAEADLKQLVTRLQAALQLSDAEAAEWLKDLPALLDKADQGAQPTEAALLYELQKVCLDQERDIYALDLVEWLLSAGKRPIKRPLPSQRLVRITRHLRSAAQLLASARLSDADRQHLARLLQTALDQSEKRLRERFRPIIAETFRDVGLRPTSPPEKAAFHKIIEELLDRLTAYGFLTFGDLRDAISRNQLKLPDLAEPEDFIRGDALLRLDRRLATLLDGVYRRAEFYQRWLERFTSLNFGTTLGRAITMFGTLPFGGAWLVAEGAELILSDVHGPAVPRFAHYTIILVLGLFLLGLLHVEPFRRGCAQAAVQFGHLLRAIFFDLPAGLLNTAVVRTVMASWPFQLFTGYLIKPLIACFLLWLWLPQAFDGPLATGAMFLAANFLLNSRPGQAAGDAVLHLLGRLYDLLRAGLLPGLIRLIVTVFKNAVEMIEYVLFTVDEWLRFRSGEGRVALAVRTVLGVLWFPISYVARFYMVVLIEPGINPIKFPISSVAAKFIYPLSAKLVYEMTTEAPLLVSVIVASTFWLLPDAFGFLFWEMKENWSLFRANRSPNLRPALVGTHGETVRRLLQPGFHSGTLPKLYARMRKAERLAAQTGNWQAVRVCARDLEEVERALARMVEREMVVLIRQSPHWQQQSLSAGRVALASNRIGLELAHPDFAAEPVCLDVEDRAGWLFGSLRQAGWLERVPGPQRQTLLLALAGFYKLVGIDLIREQLEANLPPEIHCYDITAKELVLWLDRRGGRSVRYPWDLADEPLQPYAATGEPALNWPTIDPRRLIYARVPIAWDQWVETWQKDHDGQITTIFTDTKLLANGAKTNGTAPQPQSPPPAPPPVPPPTAEAAPDDPPQPKDAP